MGEMRQSPRLRAELDAKWHAMPKVVAFAEEVEAFAWKNGLKFDKAGLDAVFAFTQQWLKEHGPLPESGILVG